MKRRRKCKDCGAYNSHHPLCPSITGKEAKKQLAMYYEQWLALELQRRALNLKPHFKRERKGYTCWVYCPICGRKRINEKI